MSLCIPYSPCKSAPASFCSANDEFDKLRIPYKDIVSATNNFADENLIKEGGTAKVYKGKLFDMGEWIDVAVRCVLKQHRVTPDEFLEEIKQVHRPDFQSKYLISMVGFCDENGENIIIMEYAINGSLDQYLITRDPTTHLMSWSQRLKICLGATRGFEYISNSCGKAYKYIDIRCSKVLLDKDLEAKISWFGPLIHKDKGYKSRNWSLGVMYFQLLFLMRESAAVIDRFVAAIAQHDFLNEKLDHQEFMDASLISKQTHPLSFSIFLNTAYECFTQHLFAAFPFIFQISRVKDALRVQSMHENIEKTMTHLKIQLSDIEECFSERNLIYLGSHEKLYKAELGPLDRKSYSTTLIESKLFDRRILVAIHCISYDTLLRVHWFFEAFKLLTSCKHHNNIVSDLLGFCWVGSDMILVFEYPLKGSLHDYLGIANIKNSLTWKQRVQICLDIARGLDSIYSMEQDKIRNIKHISITSSSVFLDDKWNAKFVSYSNAWRYSYSKEPFVYSFGVLLFEILFGRLANDAIELAEKAMGLDHIPPSLLDEQIQWEMVDQDSLDAFSKIAYQCLNLEESDQATHLTMEFIIEELQKLLSFQPQHSKRLAWSKIPFSNIKSATNDFDKTYIIGKGGYGEVYKAELDVLDSNHSFELLERKNKYQLPRKPKTVAIKRILIREDVQGKEGFLMELSVLSKCEHPNVVSLLGYCDEDSEMILIYELVANGSLDDYLTGTSNKNNFRWSQRLRVCLGIAYGIDYLHSTTKDKGMIIHRDLKSDNLLLGDNWEVKIADFGLSKVYNTNQSAGTIITNNIAGTDVYMDPTYQRHRMLKKESDIYSFGVVLFEILSGKLAYDYTYMSKDTKGLAPIARKHFKQGTLKEIVDPEIMNEAHGIGPDPDSLNTFLEIAHKCLAKAQHRRPTIKDIIEELQKALSYQEKWELNLPQDIDEKPIRLSESSSIDSKEIPLQDGNVWSDGGNGERSTEMVSATEFAYINHSSHRWRSLPADSRFQKVAEMLDTTNLMIQIETKTQHFSRNYGVHLVFKFRDSIKLSSQSISYVNLEYKRRSETLHAYFATWRDDEWMTIELSRTLYHKEDTVYKFLLKRFSPYYCADDAIYVAGIEFRPIDNVKNEEILRRSRNYYEEGEKNIWRSEVKVKQHHMLSANEVLLGFPNEKLFTSKPSTHSRFEDEIELLPQQVFCINCTIKSQMLSQDTEYACYLVFKLSQKCDGLQCPVKVRALLHQENKVDEVVYFISPNPWNVHDITRVPKQREDGRMEVIVWKFNLNDELENDCVPVNLRLMSYEGCMAGLIICGIEFRPM